MTALFIGAHPDDLEIGAGGLLRRLLTLGVEIHVAILTTERQERSRESIEALALLGVPSQRISLFDYPDGQLISDAGSVERMYKFGQIFDNLELVVAHSASDSHPDHRAANFIARSAFRAMRFLHFSVARSVELPSFAPMHFMELSDSEIHDKERALQLHRSQAERLARPSLAEYEYSLGSGIGSQKRCEAFESTHQWGAPCDLFRRLELSVFSTPHRQGAADA